MRNFITLAYFVFGLVGCDFDPASTTSSSTSINGTAINSSKTRTWANSANFDCIASASGNCRYVVFTSDCPAKNCTTKVTEAFSLRAGATRKMQGLPPGFKYCVSHQSGPVAPSCASMP